LNRNFGEPQIRSGHGGEEKNSQPLMRPVPPITQPVVQRYTTDLSRLGRLIIIIIILISIIIIIIGKNYYLTTYPVHVTFVRHKLRVSHRPMFVTVDLNNELHGDMPDTVLYRRVQLSDVIVCVNLDFDHLPVIFHKLDPVRAMGVSLGIASKYCLCINFSMKPN
jgi:hypothetical protein